MTLCSLTNDDHFVDKQKLSAPIKSAADKFQLVPEFLKVHRTQQSFVYGLYEPGVSAAFLKSFGFFFF